jgi:predicted nuclease of predicted toxin-antitoxin system
LIRVLLDQGLPHSSLPFLRAAGWDALHVIDIGMHRAADSEIIAHARSDKRVICTLDADYHALLALSGESFPSVIRIRQEGLKAKEFAKLLINTWPQISEAVGSGAMVTVTDRTIRIRRLPVI